MKGADVYSMLFPNAKQIGRLYLLPGSHARGRTFRIYVLPEGDDVIENGGINPPLNQNAVEVFGITGGQPGWSETYGWLHSGAWQNDFVRLAKDREVEIAQLEEAMQEREEQEEERYKKRQRELLSSYR